ncbi:MAG: signal recognition particle receptor subunit alpha, partial [Paracoccaceae bacterium]|nr:signal recognition particle receptor subunit alpha [Paracoccaceae bacterium]
MSFFKKLRDKMFRSSDRIGDGLDALIDAPAISGDAPADPTPKIQPATSPDLENTTTPAARPGILGRLLGRESAEEPRRVLDDAMLESLEELLIEADMGVETALRVTANIAEGRFGKRLSSTELKSALAAEIARILAPVARPMPLYPSRPQVVLVVGVNGSGKTT